MPLSILQISDLHAEPKGVLAYGAADTASRTKEIRPWLRSMSEKVDLIVVTGDIACDGNPEAYEIVRRTLEGLASPVAVLPGNHDRRSTMRRLLGPFIAPHTWSEERLDFDMDLGGARVFGLDTLVPGSHTGALPAETLARLEREIDRDPRPALILMHHTPAHSGMPKMDEPFGGREAFLRIAAKRPNIRVATGHMHRAIASVTHGVLITTAPSVALGIELDFGEEGGDAFRLAPPGYALHRLLDSGEWATHFGAMPIPDTFAGPYRFKGVVNPHED